MKLEKCLKSLNDGKEIRRESWPEESVVRVATKTTGQAVGGKFDSTNHYHQFYNGSDAYVFAATKADQEAKDWIVVGEEPKKTEEDVKEAE